MIRCWNENPKSRCTFKDITSVLSPVFTLLPRPPLSERDIQGKDDEDSINGAYEVPASLYDDEDRCSNEGSSDHYYLDLDIDQEQPQPDVHHEKLKATGTDSTATTGIEDTADIQLWYRDDGAISNTPRQSPSALKRQMTTRDADADVRLDDIHGNINAPLMSSDESVVSDAEGHAYVNPVQVTEM